MRDWRVIGLSVVDDGSGQVRCIASSDEFRKRERSNVRINGRGGAGWTCLARLAAHGIGREPVETYSNGVRHVVVLDPDGNSLSLAEAPSQ
jgi:catechol 2,3-dioxygenase-like lactoylglutathione lyase family enzyme